MEERKSGKKKSKVKKGTIAFIIVTSIVGLMIIVPVILLSIVSTLHENAAEQFNKSIYPLKYESYVEKYSKEFDVDKCLVYSIIKNESNFDPDAVSSVGAIGLMQLMPETFTWLQNYRTDFMPDKLMDSNKLYDPKVNIEYGVYLLRYLLEFYDGNTSLAVCAYNAGTGAVDNWLAEGTISSDNVLAENVPYPEKDGDIKLGYSNNLSRPKFAIMNPERTFTLPPYQTAAGVTDMMMHTMERYFTKDDDMDLTTDLAEAALRSMKNAIFAVLKNPENYRYRAQIMWGGSLMHNGLTGCGVSDDWATHQLEHELSGMFDVTHGAGLAAVWPSWARYVMYENLSRFVRFAVNVMDVPNDFTDPETTALKGIEAMERFYHAIGMPINIKELIGREITDGEIKEMVRKCSRGNTHTCGCLKVLKAEDMEAIYQMAKG